MNQNLNKIIKFFVNEYGVNKKIISEYIIDTLIYSPLIKENRYTARLKYISPPNTKGIPRTGYGFGVSDNESHAVLKGISEALERYYAGEFFYEREEKFANLPNAVHPEKLIRYQPDYYKRFPKLHFNTNHLYRWVEARALKTSQERFVVCDQIFYPINKKLLGYEPIYRANSSGVATHNSFKTAATSGFLELIERDAIALVWFSKKNIQRIISESISKTFQHKIKFWNEKNYHVNFYDFTIDSVPVVVCVFHSELSYPHITVGAKADFKLESAVVKAFQEAEDIVFALREESPSFIIKEQVHFPADHGRFYAQKSNARILINFFEERADHIYPIRHRLYTHRDLIKKFDPLVVTLHASAKLSIVKVLSEYLLPLNFGYGMEAYQHRRFTDLQIPEYRNPLPHFFP